MPNGSYRFIEEHNLKANFFELLSNFEVLNPKITPILLIFLICGTTSIYVWWKLQIH
jgi:hypothetical protein